MRPFLLITLLFMLTACGSQRRIEANMSQNENPATADGRFVFKENCQKCHPDGEAGVGPPLNSLHLPWFLIRTKIRSRELFLGLGRMPEFKKEEISDSEMDALITFMKEMRKHPDKNTVQN